MDWLTVYVVDSWMAGRQDDWMNGWFESVAEGEGCFTFLYRVKPFFSKNTIICKYLTIFEFFDRRN